jgi:hypothetical protein
VRAAIALALVVACSGRGAKAPITTPNAPATLAERVLAMLPDGAQIVVEVDLARLRANAVVGGVATAMFSDGGADKLPDLPIETKGVSLAGVDLVVLAAYGVGTTQAATVTVLATKTEVPNAARLDDDLFALGDPAWTAQLEARAAIAKRTPLVAPAELLALRDHAMPPKAPGAVLRVTARLPFDARIAFARATGLEVAPARLSIWADVVDDFAMIVDADASDPGDKRAKEAARRLAASLRTMLAEMAADPTVRALGVPHSFADARFVQEGAWVRAIIAIGPRQLARAAERARAMLGPSS